MKTADKKPSSLLFCFAHRKWDLVLHEPGHPLARPAEGHEVIYLEEPVHEPVPRPTLKTAPGGPHISIVTPVLPEVMAPDSAIGFQRSLVSMLIAAKSHDELILWYFTPKAWAFTSHVACDVCVYDRVGDETGCGNPPKEFSDWEEKLLVRADVVLRNGHEDGVPCSRATDMARLFAS